MRRDLLLPTELALREAAAVARRSYRSLLETLDRHEVIGNANLFHPYTAAIDRALGQSAADLWLWAYSETVPFGVGGDGART